MWKPLIAALALALAACASAGGAGNAGSAESAGSEGKDERMAQTDIAAGTNRAFSHTAATTAAPEAVWRLWTDPATWKDWDRGLKDASMEGPMRLGATGRIVPLSGPPARFDVTEYVEGRSYAFATRLPLARLVVRRSFVGTAPTRFRHEVSFEGFLAGFWAARFGPRFRAELPPTMEALAALAEGEAAVR